MDLAESLLSEELRSLQRRRWSGVLALSSGEVTKGLFLRDGRIVFAASSRDDEKLGETLFRNGRISREELEQACRGAQGSRGRFGTALVQSGILTGEEVAAAVSGQVQGIVLSVFEWTSGEVRRADAEQPVAADLVVELSTPRLLLEGARIFPDVRRLERALGDLGRRVRRNPSPPFDYGGLPESPPELAVLRAASGETHIRDLLDLAPYQRLGLVRAVYGLLVAGLLEDVAGDAAAVGGRAAPRPAPRHAGEPALGAADTELDEARKLIERGDRAAGIAILESRLAADPKDRPSRRLLALSLARDAGHSGVVEQHFMTALSQDPRDHDLRYRFATYYRKAGLNARAILQLRLVVGGEPGHAAAWRDLRELEGSTDPPKGRGH